MSELSGELRRSLVDKVYESRVAYVSDCIGDVARYGIDYKDLYKMTDIELIEEYESDVICFEDFAEGEVDKLQQQVRAELVINEILSE